MIYRATNPNSLPVCHQNSAVFSKLVLHFLYLFLCVLYLTLVHDSLLPSCLDCLQHGPEFQTRHLDVLQILNRVLEASVQPVLKLVLVCFHLRLVLYELFLLLVRLFVEYLLLFFQKLLFCLDLL